MFARPIAKDRIAPDMSATDKAEKISSPDEKARKTGFLEGLKESLYNSRLYDLTLNSKVPDSIRGTPVDPWPANADKARALLDGFFPYHGRKIPLAENVWDKNWAGPGARAALNGFGWLNHLRFLGTAKAADMAASLCQSWLKSNDHWDVETWRGDVLGRRLAAWFVNFSFITGQADIDLRRNLLKSAARQEKHLARTLHDQPRNSSRITALKGMIYCGVCLPGQEDRLNAGLAALAKELTQQVHPDGGHFERCPSLQLDILKDLIDIRELLILAQVEMPEALQNAIDRMAPMLRGYRHGDGKLALFNDGKEEDAALIDMALTKSEVRARAPSNAPHTGYQRMNAGRALIIMDTGKPPPQGSDRKAHLGTLGFEFSIGKTRLIVNCGAHREDSPVWHQALRATAAHSTLTIDDTNTIEVLDNGSLADNLTEVTSLRREADGNIWLETGHNGYQKLFGCHHRRNLYLSASGEDLRGEDIIEGTGGKTYAIRFHLHPAIKASRIQDGSGILIQLPDGAGWRFITNGQQLSLEESIYFGDSDDPRRSEQIVITGTLNGDGARAKWAFSKIGG